MDERFERNKHWIGLGALAIILLCVGLCLFSALASMMFGSAPAPYAQPPAVEEGEAPPSLPYYQGHGPLGMGRRGHSGPFGLLFGAIGGLFKLAFFGLLLLLLLGLVKRVFWGGRCWAPYPPGKPWKDKTGKHRHHGWGPPWTWHEHGPPWEQEADPASEAESSEPADAEYAGPQE